MQQMEELAMTGEQARAAMDQCRNHQVSAQSSAAPSLGVVIKQEAIDTPMVCHDNGTPTSSHGSALMMRRTPPMITSPLSPRHHGPYHSETCPEDTKVSVIGQSGIATSYGLSGDRGTKRCCQVCEEHASGNFFGALVCLPCKVDQSFISLDFNFCMFYI